MDYKRQMRRLSGISERLQTEVTMLQKELKEVKEVNAKRKEGASGKWIILKDKSILSTEEVHQALKEAEEITYAKKLKKKKGMIKKVWKQKVLSSEIHNVASYWGDEDDNLNVAESLHLEDVEILECIEVVF
jgi:hypothetical protein